MFNRLKQEITMKKYIAPVVKSITLGSERNMLLNGSNNYADTDGFQQYSNERQHSASEVIWGFDDEADAKY